MIEWANAWAKGITYRREHNQDVGGFFAQVGQLYMVFHIWAYKDMVHRNHTRQHTWSKPGWDTNVAYTGESARDRPHPRLPFSASDQEDELQDPGAHLAVQTAVTASTLNF